MDKKTEILQLTNIVQVKQPRTRTPKDSCCDVCGVDHTQENKFRRFNEYILCPKHYNQLKKYGKITDASSVVHKKEMKPCSICGDLHYGYIDGVSYCRKHMIQIKRYGKIEKTIYDKNEYIIHDDYAEIITYNKNCDISYHVKIDIDKIEELKKYKIYCKGYGNKIYANLNFPGGKKIRLNRYLFGITDPDEWDGKIVIDHINGDSLDNRMCNLRKCTHKQNMQNIRKKTFVGVKRNNTDTKWTASIMHNYKAIWLGCYDTKEEAMLARLKGEKEIFGEFGPNKDLYNLINHPSALEELRKVIMTEGA